MGFVDVFYYGQGKLVCTTQDAGDNGKTVRVTASGGRVWTGTMASKKCSFTLPPTDSYTIELLNGSAVQYSTSIELGYGEHKTVDVGFTLANWAGIKRIINAHKAADYINNGDRFTVTLSAGEVLVYEANVNTYGLGEVDFIPTYCMAVTKQHHTSNTNSGGWNNSDIRNFLNNTFLLTLPADLQEVISVKPVKATIGSQNNSLQTAEDKIWLPTEKEIFGQITYSGSVEGPVNNQYPIFTDAASRVRTQGSNGSAVYVWLASPDVGSSNNFCSVTAAGAPNGNYASNSDGVLPCFRIAPAA